MTGIFQVHVVPRMVYADSTGRIFDHPKLNMAVFDGFVIREPRADELIPLPPGSDMFLLPGRAPVGLSGKRSRLVELEGDVTAVSAFLAPGYLRLTHPAYRTLPDAPILPLFAYSPVGWADGVFWTTALRIDPEPRQDPALFDLTEVKKGVSRDLRHHPNNMLLKQLRRCALDYKCRAAQNFFLKRWECPLPTATSCNSKCLGCISYQEGDIPVAQERLVRTPSGADVAEVALMHFSRVKEPIASFGQGCEGEPLTQAGILIDAVRRIRKRTSSGTINLNSNASLPDAVEELFRSGLSSLRVTLASPSPNNYARYHRPVGYNGLPTVLESIRRARSLRGFVSLNLLVFPGFTDREGEVEALKGLIEEYDVQMIQWRNLNIDPEYFLEHMGRQGGGIGILAMLKRLSTTFPHLRHGYFNPWLG